MLETKTFSKIVRIIIMKIKKKKKGKPEMSIKRQSLDSILVTPIALKIYFILFLNLFLNLLIYR